tara:strand:- start:98 stop:325 length:228 start_codon:yes stop_codon:yes gene_type:complete
MNIKELRELLKSLPDDMEILNERCSDYQIVRAAEWQVVKGVDKSSELGGWVMKAHPTMSAENKAKEKSYLLLLGN